MFADLALYLLPRLHRRVRAAGAGGWTAAINWAVATLPPSAIPAAALLAALRRAPSSAASTALLLQPAAAPGVHAGIVFEANAA